MPECMPVNTRPMHNTYNVTKSFALNTGSNALKGDDFESIRDDGIRDISTIHRLNFGNRKGMR